MSYNLKTNNTTLFLVPPLGISDVAKREHGFISAYLGDINKPEIQYERGIFMLFKPPNVVMFDDWLDDEKIRTPNLVEDYDYEDGYVVVIYILDKRFASDYQKFLEGKYSKFSMEFKSRFSKTVKLSDHMGRGRDEVTWQWRIFKKDPSIREHWEQELGIPFTEDMEVWSSPDTDFIKGNKEMLDIHRIKGEKYAKSQ